eukprot:9073468-Alexandrium_andersonii.AAC.1
MFPRLQFTRAALLNCICYLVRGDHRRGQRLWSRVLPDRAGAFTIVDLGCALPQVGLGELSPRDLEQ